MTYREEQLIVKRIDEIVKRIDDLEKRIDKFENKLAYDFEDDLTLGEILDYFKMKDNINNS